VRGDTTTYASRNPKAFQLGDRCKSRIQMLLVRRRSRIIDSIVAPIEINADPWKLIEQNTSRNDERMIGVIRNIVRKDEHLLVRKQASSVILAAVLTQIDDHSNSEMSCPQSCNQFCCREGGITAECPLIYSMPFMIISKFKS
jgi:hypothetical protein